MVTHAQRSPETAQHHPAIDPQLHYRLKSKFGAELLKEGFTGIPVLVQRYYRRVPGNPLPCEDGTPSTEPSYMTPTEFDVMTDMWSYWWSADILVWPSAGQVAHHLGKSKRMIQRYLNRLRDKGFMISLSQFSQDGRQLSNRYDFSPFLRKLVDYLESIGELESNETLEKPGKPDKPDKPDKSNKGEGDTSDDRRVTSMTGGRVTFVSPKTDIKTEVDQQETDEKKIRIRMVSSSKKKARKVIPPQQDEYLKEQPENILLGLEKMPRDAAVDALIRRCAAIFNDQPALCERWRMKSNMTRARNLIMGIIGADDDRQVPDQVDPQIIWTTQELLEVMARAIAETMHKCDEEITMRNAGDGSANKMPYFYQRFAACLSAAQERKEGEAWVASSFHQRHETSAASDASALLPDSSAGLTDGVFDDKDVEVAPVPVVSRLNSFDPGRARGVEEKVAREKYAKNIRIRLFYDGIVGPEDLEVNSEHHCGCPLFKKQGLRRVCAYCTPDPSWPENVRELIASILDE